LVASYVPALGSSAKYRLPFLPNANITYAAKASDLYSAVLQSIHVGKLIRISWRTVLLLLLCQRLGGQGKKFGVMKITVE
jgi:hypothetical protein